MKELLITLIIAIVCVIAAQTASVGSGSFVYQDSNGKSLQISYTYNGDDIKITSDNVPPEEVEKVKAAIKAQMSQFNYRPSGVLGVGYPTFFQPKEQQPVVIPVPAPTVDVSNRIGETASRYYEVEEYTTLPFLQSPHVYYYDTFWHGLQGRYQNAYDYIRGILNGYYY